MSDYHSPNTTVRKQSFVRSAIVDMMCVNLIFTLPNSADNSYISYAGLSLVVKHLIIREMFGLQASAKQHDVKPNVVECTYCVYLAKE